MDGPACPRLGFDHNLSQMENITDQSGLTTQAQEETGKIKVMCVRSVYVCVCSLLVILGWKHKPRAKKKEVKKKQEPR